MLFSPNNTTKDYLQISVSISNNCYHTKTKLSQVACYKYLGVTLNYKHGRNMLLILAKRLQNALE